MSEKIVFEDRVITSKGERADFDNCIVLNKKFKTNNPLKFL